MYYKRDIKMAKKIRQYFGLFIGIIVYFIIHEGAHFIYSSLIGTFKSVNFMSLGIQIDVYHELMSDMQMGIFCFVGPLATLIVAYIFVLFTPHFSKLSFKIVKASFYYSTLALLFVDPLYLSVLSRFVGGGDMNGIVLLIPKNIMTITFVLIFIFNLYIFLRKVLPLYKIKTDPKGERSVGQN